ncbi:hypothetical protein BLOT_001938 [Blomia tropicalis]|nr:hypothetical protein BLOT_001938 [Blomia tropicalis]
MFNLILLFLATVMMLIIFILGNCSNENDADEEEEEFSPINKMCFSNKTKSQLDNKMDEKTRNKSSKRHAYNKQGKRFNPKQIDSMKLVDNDVYMNTLLKNQKRRSSSKKTTSLVKREASSLSDINKNQASKVCSVPTKSFSINSQSKGEEKIQPIKQ